MGESDLQIRVDILRQRLSLLNDDKIICQYPVSTATNGAGEINGSECTPRGLHVIKVKIGDGCKENTIFVGRRLTGENYSESLGSQYPHRDWILTRIMWLGGLEPGRNRFGNVDTLRRFIYIHGCPDLTEMGKPGSHGCIRMRNSDVIDLFDRVTVGTRVLIEENLSL